jgi:hypothetical protein
VSVKKLDYVEIAKEMAAAKQLYDAYYERKFRTWIEVENEYRRITGKHRCAESIKKYARGIIE